MIFGTLLAAFLYILLAILILAFAPLLLEALLMLAMTLFALLVVVKCAELILRGIVALT